MKAIVYVGDIALDRFLKELAGLDAKDLEGVALQAVEPIRSQAEALAPRRTGRLARSIESRVTKSTKDEIEVEVGSDLAYAGFVELGTEDTSARPYLRPATDANEAAAVAALIRELDQKLGEME